MQGVPAARMGVLIRAFQDQGRLTAGTLAFNAKLGIVSCRGILFRGGVRGRWTVVFREGEFGWSEVDSRRRL